MKRIKFLLIAIVGVFFITGCDTGKKLSCTMTENDDGIKIVNNVVAKFDGDKTKNLKMEMITIAESNATKKRWSSLVKTLDSSFSSFAKAEGFSIKFNKNDKNYSYGVTINIDFKKANDQDLSAFDLDSISTYNELKENFETQGYTCK